MSWDRFEGQDGPRLPQDRVKITPRPPLYSPKIGQDRHSMPKTVPRGRHEGLSVVFCSDFSDSAKSVCFSILLGLSAWLGGVLVASWGISGTSRGDVASLEGVLEVALGRLGGVLDPKTLQDHHKTSPRSLEDRLQTAPRLTKIVTICLKSAQDDPRPRQDCFKTAARLLQDGSRPPRVSL